MANAALKSLRHMETKGNDDDWRISVDLTAVDSIPIMPWQYATEKGPNGQWGGSWYSGAGAIFWPAWTSRSTRTSLKRRASEALGFGLSLSTPPILVWRASLTSNSLRFAMMGCRLGFTPRQQRLRGLDAADRWGARRCHEESQEGEVAVEAHSSMLWPTTTYEPPEAHAHRF